VVGRHVVVELTSSLWVLLHELEKVKVGITSGILALPAQLKKDGYTNPSNGKECAFQRGFRGYVVETDIHPARTSLVVGRHVVVELTSSLWVLLHIN
jgi:hypothetical protein